MNLTVTASPHIRGGDTTKRIMTDVLIALLPTLIAGTLIFTYRALLVCAVSILAALAGEAVYQLLTKQPVRLRDMSAVVTGLLLALTLPVTVPYHIPLIGGFFATFVVKGIGGRLGHNCFNPALASRALLMLLFPVGMVRFTAPFGILPAGNIDPADIITSATPLHTMQMPALPRVELTDLLLGKTGGCIGEVCTVALLVGGAYLVFRKVISLRIPGAYLLTVALLTLIFAKDENVVAWMAYSLLSGGVMLGAIFMATDYASSPVEQTAQIVYGAGCGVLTVVFRYFGLFPEGVTYAILMMNGIAPLLDRLFARRIYGAKKG